MGTICILLGVIIFLLSIFFGCAVASSCVPIAAPWINQFPGIFAFTQTQLYIAIVGACAFVGLLICLNLVMHGLTYNKLAKLSRRKQH